MYKTYKTKGYVVLEGSIAEGYVAYGPFADAVKAFDFQQELKDTHGGRNDTIIFSLIDPKREFATWGKKVITKRGYVRKDDLWSQEIADNMVQVAWDHVVEKEDD